MIKPTVGRKVWYWPSAFDKSGPGAMAQMFEKPLDATVVAVHSDHMVNLAVFDANANLHKRTSVTLRHEGDVLTAGTAFAEWTPYQTKQAEKQVAPLISE
jgi:hypothetical protein